MAKENQEQQDSARPGDSEKGEVPARDDTSEKKSSETGVVATPETVAETVAVEDDTETETKNKNEE